MTPLRVLVTLALLGLTAGCAPQMDDLVAYTNQVKQTTQSRIEPYPEFTQQPAFVYSASEFRSPFMRPQRDQAPVVTQVKANCTQPDLTRAKEPLESYGIDALQLTGSFRSNGADWVLFKTNDGNLYQAKAGNRIGLFFGKIINVKNNSVIIEELVPDGTGCWQRDGVAEAGCLPRRSTPCPANDLRLQRCTPGGVNPVEARAEQGPPQ